MSIIVRSEIPGFAVDIFSGRKFNETGRYYRRDENGVYYIPVGK
jgi:hypothetical protein